MAVYSEQDYADGYPDGIQLNYWNLGRNYIVHHALKHWITTKEKILEIGCGRGFVVEYLCNHSFDCYGVENAKAPILSSVKNRVFSPQDAFLLDEAFRNTIEYILLLDVVEHIEDSKWFLDQMLLSYPNVKKIIVTVPARMELWSNFDEYYGHFKRFDLQSLEKMATSSNLRVRHSRYFFHLLYIAGRIHMLLKKSRPTILKAPPKALAFIHKALAIFFSLESKIIPAQWWGTSIIGVLELAQPLSQPKTNTNI